MGTSTARWFGWLLVALTLVGLVADAAPLSMAPEEEAVPPLAALRSEAKAFRESRMGRLREELANAEHAYDEVAERGAGDLGESRGGENGLAQADEQSLGGGLFDKVKQMHALPKAKVVSDDVKKLSMMTPEQKHVLSDLMVSYEASKGKKHLLPADKPAAKKPRQQALRKVAAAPKVRPVPVLVRPYIPPQPHMERDVGEDQLSGESLETEVAKLEREKATITGQIAADQKHMAADQKMMQAKLQRDVAGVSAKASELQTVSMELASDAATLHKKAQVDARKAAVEAKKADADAKKAAAETKVAVKASKPYVQKKKKAPAAANKSKSKKLTEKKTRVAKKVTAKKPTEKTGKAPASKKEKAPDASKKEKAPASKEKKAPASKKMKTPDAKKVTAKKPTEKKEKAPDASKKKEANVAKNLSPAKKSKAKKKPAVKDETPNEADRNSAISTSKRILKRIQGQKKSIEAERKSTQSSRAAKDGAAAAKKQAKAEAKANAKENAKAKVKARVSWRNKEEAKMAVIEKEIGMTPPAKNVPKAAPKKAQTAQKAPVGKATAKNASSKAPKKAAPKKAAPKKAEKAPTKTNKKNAVPKTKGTVPTTKKALAKKAEKMATKITAKKSAPVVQLPAPPVAPALAKREAAISAQEKMAAMARQYDQHQMKKEQALLEQNEIGEARDVKQEEEAAVERAKARFLRDTVTLNKDEHVTTKAPSSLLRKPLPMGAAHVKTKHASVHSQKPLLSKQSQATLASKAEKMAEQAVVHEDAQKTYQYAHEVHPVE